MNPNGERSRESDEADGTFNSDLKGAEEATIKYMQMFLLPYEKDEWPRFR